MQNRQVMTLLNRISCKEQQGRITQDVHIGNHKDL